MHNRKLTVEDTTPEGLKPLLTEQQIKNITDSYLPIDREAESTVHGMLEYYKGEYLKTLFLK